MDAAALPGRSSREREGVRRTLQRVFGVSEDAAFACLALIASALAYILASTYLRVEAESLDYRLFLFREYYRRFGLPNLLPVRPQTAGALQLLLFIATCIVVGVLARIYVRARRGADTGVTVYALTAALLPTLLLALLGWPDGAGWLTTPNLLIATFALLIGAAALVVITRVRAVGGPGHISTTYIRGGRWSPLFLIALAPLLLAVWWCGVSAVQGYDSLWYHLPLPARWLMDSRLTRAPEITLTDFYPGNFEVLARWALLLGTPRFAFVVNVIGGILCLTTLYFICLELGQTREAARIVVACAATISVFANLMVTAYSDIFGALGILLAVLLLLRWIRTDDNALLVGVGVSLGIAVGTKYTALPPALIILCALLWHLLRGRRTARPIAQPLTLKQIATRLTLVALPALLCAGYWYVRNAVEHGNPVFPVSMFGLHGVTLDYLVPRKPGLPESPIHRLLFPWSEYGFKAAYYDDGFGLIFGAIAVPAFLLMPALGNFAKRGTTTMVWFMTLAMFAYWISTGSLYARFGLIPVLLSIVFIGEVWQRFPSLLLKAMIVVCFLAGTALLTLQIGAVAAYSNLLPPGRRGVPAAVDQLPRSYIFNAVPFGPELNLPLMGVDYRHRVVSPFVEATPQVVASAKPEYVLLKESQIRAFTKVLPLSYVASDSTNVYGRLTLWKIGIEAESKK
jgi:hypothetical protein